MKFTHNGKEYRIIFRHDRSRALSAHVGHSLTVIPEDGFGGKKRLSIGCFTCRGPEPGTALKLFPLNNKQTRRTHVEIQVKVFTDTWITLHSGTGKVNQKAGDVFSRGAGREAALVNAIGKPECAKGTFEYAVWLAFFARKPNQKRLLQAVGAL